MRLVNPRGACRRNPCAAGLRVSVALALIVAVPPRAWAYVPPVADLWARLAAGAPPIRSAIIDTETLVYDPSVSGSGAPGEPPKPVAGREFRQRIYWQRGAVFAVETTDAGGTPLHLLLRDGYRTYAQPLSTKRAFAETDLRPLLYAFLEASPSAWHDELVFWGIQPLAVDVMLYKTGIAYLLGEGAGQSLWIDPDSDRPIRLEVKVAGQVPMRVTIQFAEFRAVAPKDADAANPRLPKVLSYEVNDRLFRRTTVTDVQADPSPRSFPMAKWRQQLGLDVSPPAYGLGPIAPVRP